MESTSVLAQEAGPSPFGIRRFFPRDYEDILARVPSALASEGFGILTEIDVRETLKRKLGVDFRRYKILGSCNPALAHRALEADLDVGLMLPCNVIVYEANERGTVVAAIDPTQTAAVLGNPAIAEVAVEVRRKLERALDRIH